MCEQTKNSTSPKPQSPSGDSVLIYALSGLGKSTLCELYPELTYDTDRAFDAALAETFPGISIQERRIRWRQFAQSQPWSSSTSREFRVWAKTRRDFVGRILDVLEAPGSRVVLTNMTLIPWRYHHYYGIKIGEYEAHWALTDRCPDNDQTEVRNNRLEGFSPLTRLPPGDFLSNQPEIIRLVEELRV